MYEQGANQLAPFANKTRERAALQFSVEYIGGISRNIRETLNTWSILTMNYLCSNSGSIYQFF